MVGAVTGTEERPACMAIQAAAGEDDEHPTHLLDCRFRHQCRAIELLGYALRAPNGELFEARNLPNEFQIPPGAPTIAEFVRNNHQQGVLACYAGGRSPEGAPEAHSFAVEGRYFFDNNVGDNVVPVEGIPERVRNYRMVVHFLVRRRT
jgi:hypothetical protein